MLHPFLDVANENITFLFRSSLVMDNIARGRCRTLKNEN